MKVSLEIFIFDPFFVDMCCLTLTVTRVICRMLTMADRCRQLGAVHEIFPDGARINSETIFVTACSGYPTQEKAVILEDVVKVTGKSRIFFSDPTSIIICTVPEDYCVQKNSCPGHQDF
jgi:hypothetical protein